jgi:hypothetical protein
LTLSDLEPRNVWIRTLKKEAEMERKGRRKRRTGRRV